MAQSTVRSIQSVTRRHGAEVGSIRTKWSAPSMASSTPATETSILQVGHRVAPRQQAPGQPLRQICAIAVAPEAAVDQSGQFY